jgi:hypothetical protein
MYKKGQVTIFIILGCILLLFVGLFFSLVFASDEETLNQSTLQQFTRKKMNVKGMVENCIDIVGERALITVGQLGGKAHLVNPYYEDEVIFSNYVYYEGEDFFDNDVKTALEVLMNENLAACVGFAEDSETTYQGISITTDTIKTTVTLGDEEVLFVVSWPLTLYQETMEATLTDFGPSVFSIRLTKLMDVADEIVQQLMINPYFLDIFFLLQYNLSYDIAVLEEGTFIIVMSDELYQLYDEPYLFLLTVKLPEEES